MLWSALVFVVILNVVWVVAGSSFVSISQLPQTLIPIRRDTIQRRDTAQGSGISSLELSNNKQSYFAVIKTGVISFRVALDTASADLWLISTACTTATCQQVPRYPLAYPSATFVSINNNLTSFSAKYLDGTVASGFVARETVQLSNLTIPNQAFSLITASNLTMDDNVSGIMGLGFPRLSAISNTLQNATPFFTGLAQQGQLAYPLFGLSLTWNETGTLAIGAIDSSVVTNVSNIGWNEVTTFSPYTTERNTSSYLQWAIPLSGFAVNGSQLISSPTYPTATSNLSLALFDIGTPGIYGPWQDVSRLFNLLTGSRLVDTGGQWAVPCSISETMTLSFGTKNYTLQPSDYLIGPTVGEPSLCLTWPRALPPSSDGIDWQIGTAFLRTVYSVFSYGINGKEPPMIGLYPLSNVTGLTESPAAVSSFLSSASATVATTLPQFPLSTLTYTTPGYTFNTSVPASVGKIVFSELGTSTYSPILVKGTVNATALPVITPTTLATTVTKTGANGAISTFLSNSPSPTLGVPPGWSSNTGTAVTASLRTIVLLSLLSFSLTFVPLADFL